MKLIMWVYNNVNSRHQTYTQLLRFNDIDQKISK